MKQQLIYSCLTFFIIALTNGSISGQIQNNDPTLVPKFTYESPEVAGFKRYGDIPVSLYTGLPEIIIPLYTVKTKSNEVSINLSYNAGGITIDQEATCVGLGWNLFAGGSISVSQVASRDQPGLVEPWSDWESAINYSFRNSYPESFYGSSGEDGLTGWGCGVDKVNSQTNARVVLLATRNGQGEQDVYNVSLPNRSFKFSIDPSNGDPFFIGDKNKCKIEIFQIYSFKITDEEGIQYIFGVFETPEIGLPPNCWYLTQIIDYYGNEINFEYQNFGSIHKLLQRHERIAFKHPYNPQNITFSTDINLSNYYLSAIRTNIEEVKFLYSGNRLDLEGGGVRQLDSITVTDLILQNVTQRFAFDYGYFSACNVGGNFITDTEYAPLEPSDAMKLRLKLERVTLVNPKDNSDFQSYEFNYHEENTLPLKTSFAKDFWGFYNGQENGSQLYGNINHTLIPNPRVLAYMQEDYADFVAEQPDFQFDECANRFSHSEYIKTGTIETITYPTGGKTKFEFEPHQFYNTKFISAEDFNTFDKIIGPIAGVSDLNDPYGYSNVSEPFVLEDSTTVRFTGGVNTSSFPGYDLSGCTIGIVSTSNGFNLIYDFADLDPIDETLTLAPGNYLLLCGAPPEIPFNNYIAIVNANLNSDYYDINAINSVLDKPFIGGGLRIKKITNYNNTDEIVSTWEYAYEKDGLSSGRLISKMGNLTKEFVRIGYVGTPPPPPDPPLTPTWFRQDTITTIYADRILPVYYSSGSSNVVYDRVLVKQTNGNSYNGMEVTDFTNDSPDYFHDFGIYVDGVNGQIKQKILLNEDNDTVKVVKYHYEQNHFSKELLNLHVTDKYYGPTNHCDPLQQFVNPLAYEGRFHLFTYAIPNYINQLVKTETYDYYNNGTVSSIVENSYDDFNFQLDTLSFYTEKGLRRTTYQYPHDDPTYFSHARMLEDNVINPVIIQKEYLDDNLLKTTENHYWFYNDYSTVALHDIKTGFENNLLKTEIVFNNYALNGNVLDLQKPDDVLYAYLWSYGEKFPVIYATNVDYVTLNSAVTGIMQTYFGSQSIHTFIAGLSDMTLVSAQNSWKLFNEKLRNESSLAKALITTYTYSPLIGMTSQTDPNGNSTYYEYDPTGRLVIIRDNTRHILKQITYNYAQ